MHLQRDQVEEVMGRRGGIAYQVNHLLFQMLRGHHILIQGQILIRVKMLESNSPPPWWSRP